MRRALLLLLLSGLGIAVFGIGVGPIVSNALTPAATPGVYDGESSIGLRLVIGPLDMGILTPFYDFSFENGSFKGGAFENLGQSWTVYGGMKLGIGPLYLFGRAGASLSGTFVPTGDYFGVAGAGLGLGGLFLEGGALFEIPDVSTIGKSFQVNFGLLF